MPKITTARAWANNEVAYIAWDTDGKIEDCLGFEVTRVYVDAADKPIVRADGSEDRVKCAAWVCFKGQRNPNWLPQDTGVWPVQKFSWRDLTLRKKRDRAERRPDEVRARYEIRPVGKLEHGRAPVQPNGREVQTFPKKDPSGMILRGSDHKVIKVTGPAYQGPPIPLGYLAPATTTNSILVTSRRAPFRTTFTNGILAAQWLRNVLLEDNGTIGKGELLKKISDPADPHRKYLAGDVLPLLHDLFARKGTFHLALYELDDEELVALLLENAERVHVILSNSAAKDGEWDARNAAARERLRDAGIDLQDRMFNNGKHIGHNKFVVHVDPGGAPRAVLTGSTNWTSTGVAGQTNNAILVENDEIAKVFRAYWTRLHDDVQKTPRPLSKAMPDNQQGQRLRTADETPAVATAGGATLQAWFSPNRPEREKPRSKKHPAPTPPDLQEIYRRIRQAQQAVLFLAFYPSQRGVDSIIGEAIDIGRKDRSLVVVGAVSSAQAMPNYVPKQKDEDGEIADEGASPATFDEENISLVRASRIDDETILADFGAEQLTANGAIGAIIHDKILVIDPLSPSSCMVALGSHNLGFKASYSNDENLLVVTGHRDLAVAYAVHVLDVFDHYRFRAAEQDLKRQGKKGWSGFLDVDDRWQDDYVRRRKGAISRYFAR